MIVITLKHANNYFRMIILFSELMIIISFLNELPYNFLNDFLRQILCSQREGEEETEIEKLAMILKELQLITNFCLKRILNDYFIIYGNQ